VPQAELIVIDEIIDSGVKINFFIGSDSNKVYESIITNGFTLDAVDSDYVFIISQDELNQLYTCFFSINLDYYNVDSILATQPQIIRVRAYGQNSVVLSNDFLNSDFQKTLPDKWLLTSDNLSEGLEKMILNLKNHSFIQ